MMQERSPLVEKILSTIAKQWIAGNTIEDVIKSARLANKNGMNVTLNKLGEHTISKQQVKQTVEDYLTLIASLRKTKIRGGISIKPTQVGLALSKKDCMNNMNIIIEKALKSQSFVWIDMESSKYTSDIFDLYLELFERYENIGTVIQANLKRTKKDLQMLLKKGAKLQLVKGAYQEKSSNVYTTRKDVDENYKKLMSDLFEQTNEFVISTHDSKLIDVAIQMSKKYEKRIEFQMLKGIRDNLKLTLVKNGYGVSEYIPYGTNWLPYTIRRLQERKINITFEE